MSEITLEQSITRTVASQLDEDYDTVFHLLRGKEVYLTLEEPLSSSPGRPQVPSYQVGTLRCVKVYTTKTHPGMGRPFGGLTWESVMEMIDKVPELDGIKIVNVSNDWVAFSKGMLRALQSKY